MRPSSPQAPWRARINHIGLGTQLQHALPNGRGLVSFRLARTWSRFGSLRAYLFKGLGNGGLKGIHRTVGPFHAKNRSTRATLCPLERRASHTMAPEDRDTLRSGLRPPANTTIFILNDTSISVIKDPCWYILHANVLF